MNKNKFFIIIWLIIFLWIWLFAYNSYTKIKQKEKEIALRELKEKEVQEKLEDLEVKPTLEIKKEEKTSSWENLENQKDDSKKTLQDTLKAEAIDILTFTNVKQCDNLKYLKEKCKNNFVYELSIENNDLSYCEQLKTPEQISSCKDEINLKNLNCNNINNSFLKEKCLYNLNKKNEINIIKNADNADECKKLSDYANKENCIKKIILEKKDLNLCNSVFSNKTEQTNCIKNISYDFNRDIINEAYTKKDLSLCEKILDQNIKTQCKSMTF